MISRFWCAIESEEVCCRMRDETVGYWKYWPAATVKMRDNDNFWSVDDSLGAGKLRCRRDSACV